MKSVIKKLWGYIGGINALLLILYTTFILSSFAFIAETDLKYFLRWFLLIIVISIIACPVVLRFVKRLEIKQSDLSGDNDGKNEIKWKIIFFVVPLVMFLTKYIIYYPGAFSTDSIKQYTQAISNHYNDWHPVIQTLITIKLPLLLTGGWIGSIILFQITVFSIVIAYSLFSIYKYTNIKFALVTLLFVMLNPQTTNMAMYPWKDVSFAIGALLLITYSFKIFITKGGWIKSPLNMVFFVITASLTTLFRHNALLFTIPLVIAVLLYMTKKQGLIICLSIIVLCLGVKIPLYSAIGVEKPDRRQLEILGLPMTIIGAAVTYAPEQLDEDILDFAYKIAPKELWKENYKLGCYNYVKFDKRTDNDVVDEYGTEKVLDMTLRCIKQCPILSIKDIVKVTEVTYSICDDYRYYEDPDIVNNQYNLTTQGIPVLQSINSKLSNVINLLFPRLFMYIGSLHLILIISILAKCRLNKWKDWKKILLVIPTFIYNFGTTLLLTEARDSSRFFYYTFLITPTLLVILFYKNNEKEYEYN